MPQTLLTPDEVPEFHRALMAMDALVASFIVLARHAADDDPQRG